MLEHSIAEQVSRYMKEKLESLVLKPEFSRAELSHLLKKHGFDTLPTPEELEEYLQTTLSLMQDVVEFKFSLGELFDDCNAIKPYAEIKSGKRQAEDRQAYLNYDKQPIFNTICAEFFGHVRPYLSGVVNTHLGNMLRYFDWEYKTCGGIIGSREHQEDRFRFGKEVSKLVIEEMKHIPENYRPKKLENRYIYACMHLPDKILVETHTECVKQDFTKSLNEPNLN